MNNAELIEEVKDMLIGVMEDLRDNGIYTLEIECRIIGAIHILDEVA